jgi:short-subunit dehydrogenase
MRKVIIIGASSGIGEALARKFSSEHFEVGLMARRIYLLNKLKRSLKTRTYVQQVDLSEKNAKENLSTLIKKMKKVDIIIINAGIGYINEEFDLNKELQTIEVNTAGFVKMANTAYKYFKRVKKGHIVGVSSIMGIRGSKTSAYSASKAFISNYLVGLRVRAYKDGVSCSITDICPGFVKTRMAKGEGQFWVASKEKAAEQIFVAIQKKKKKAYISKRWITIGTLLKFLPFNIYKRL